MYGDQPQWLRYFLVLLQMCKKKPYYWPTISLCYLRKKRSTAIWFTWYAIIIYQCRDVHVGMKK